MDEINYTTQPDVTNTKGENTAKTEQEECAYHHDCANCPLSKACGAAKEKGH